MLKKVYTILIFLFFVESAYARHVNPQFPELPEEPWFTGPLLSPSSRVTRVGHVNFEPIYYRTDTNGFYDSKWKKHSTTSFIENDLELYLTIGLTEWMDLLFDPGVVYQACRGQEDFVLDDMEVGFDFQLLKDSPDDYWPAIKLGVREIFPSAKYDHLNPKKFFTDQGGFGSYQTIVFLCAGRVFQIREHWLNLRFSVSYNVQSRVHVRGFNLFGGAKNTNAYVYPPQSLAFDLAWEWSLNRNWVIACDMAGGFAKKRTFKGFPGRLPSGQLADFSKGAAASFQIAPALEYNWNSHIGVISGAWFPLIGRNSDAFISWVTGINIYY